MRSRVAERLLSLLMPLDRASSILGDLSEESGARGRWWVWLSAVRIGYSFLRHQFTSASFALVASAALSWPVYMGVSLVLIAGGVIAAMLAWGVLYVLANHTGVELLTDALRLQFDGPPSPLQLMFWVQPLVMWAAAPYLLGRLAGRRWPGREAAVLIVLLVVWPVMAAFVPFVVIPGALSPPGRPDVFVATGTSVSVPGTVLMLVFVSWGVIRQRLLAVGRVPPAVR